MKTAIKHVTPALAQSWLGKLYSGQRPLRQHHVEKIARHMRAGTFVSNGDSVRFDCGGRLIDGQHRLHAIVVAQVPQTLVVVTGLPTDAYATIDQGAKRSPSDLLRFKGIEHHSIKATIANKYLRAFNQSPTTMEVAEYAEANNETLDAVVLILEDFRSSKWTVTKSCIGAAAMHMLLKGCDEIDVASMFTLAASGAGLSSEHPIMALRDALMSGHGINGFWHGVNGRSQTINVVALCVHVWNKWRAGQTVRRVRVPRKGKLLRIAEPAIEGAA